MNKFFLTGLVLVTCFTLSCTDSSQQEAIDKTEKEVFDIHDEVMPKISDIMKLRKQLSQRITALDSTARVSPSATLSTDDEKEQAIRLNQHLAEADSLMMDWMNGYNGDTLKKLESADALRYLEQEKRKISDVKQKINSSIEQAQQYLKKL